MRGMSESTRIVQRNVCDDRPVVWDRQVIKGIKQIWPKFTHESTVSKIRVSVALKLPLMGAADVLTKIDFARTD